jgi:glycosyltransferase involved in cell wall biosynthesis
MRIAIATTQTPYVIGGAEYLANNLINACRETGHQVEVISQPFLDESSATVDESLSRWTQDNFSLWGSRQPDLVICLKFPAFYIAHECKIMWTLHQHRSVYDLWDYSQEQGHQHSTAEDALRQKVTALDNDAFGSALQNFTISKTVSKRLKHYNNISSTPLYHPPALAEALFRHDAASEIGDYIFAPSRLEPLKRQHLLLEALRLTTHPIKAVLCGQGSYENHLRNFVIHHGLQDRVMIHTQLSDADMVKHYKNSLAVFFGPYDEDYGYVTLEAMLAKKAVITCCDSGGTNEFVVHEQTGFIEPPGPEQLAARLDALYLDKKLAKSMGENAYAHYHSLSLSWDNVLNHLLY